MNLSLNPFSSISFEGNLHDLPLKSMVNDNAIGISTLTLPLTLLLVYTSSFTLIVVLISLLSLISILLFLLDLFYTFILLFTPHSVQSLLF